MDSRAWGGLLTFFTQLYPHAFLDKGKRKNGLFALWKSAEIMTLTLVHKELMPLLMDPAPIGRDKDS